MFTSIMAPTQKIQILNRILKLLMSICILQTIFLLFSHKLNALSYGISSLTYFISYRKLSYFGCIINQIINFTLIWNVLLEMANRLENGLTELNLTAEQIYKMSSLIFNIVCIYFNFIAYQAFKQLAYEIYLYQKSEDNQPYHSIYREIRP